MVRNITIQKQSIETKISQIMKNGNLLNTMF